MDVATELGCLLLLARGDLTTEEQGRARGLLAQPLAWRDILRSADEHGVFPAVVRNLRRLGWPNVPEGIRKELEAAERFNAVRNRLLARGLATILGRFAQAGIPVIPLKGVALAESLYGDASLRVCSDVDILVPRRAVGHAIELLQADGFRGADRYLAGATEIDLLLRSNMEYCLDSPPASFHYVLELHWDIAWRWRADSEMVDHLWTDARPGTVLGADAWALSPEWELLYLALHAARHRWSALKWLVDIHEICVRGGLDWTGVEDRARRFGLERPCPPCGCSAGPRTSCAIWGGSCSGLPWPNGRWSGSRPRCASSTTDCGRFASGSQAVGQWSARDWAACIFERIFLGS